MNKKKDLSEEDKKVWEDYLKNPSDLHDKDKINLKSNQIKARFQFDLHGFTLEEANKKVDEIIQYCIKKKYKELLLITGKGIHSSGDKNSYVSKDFSKLKYSVPDFIKTHQEINKFVISIDNAKKQDGGEGAILIKLKKL